ncbi:hypothetical protein F5Y11DRAFT_330017 [Daldinia sp. FL1419]|nr:hypothetical protein F5Y11DRAFT_330017 [Daldinia sp. FL1419]
MASSNSSVFSEAIQQVTNIKFQELSKRRSDFETAKSHTLSMLENEKGPTERLRILSRGVRTCYLLGPSSQVKISGASLPVNQELELELKNLEFFLAQAKYDPSISIDMLKQWEESLLHHMNTQSLKYQYASLYAQLVTEWLSTEKSRGRDELNATTIEGFEDVPSAMKQNARQEWERIIFESANTNEDELRSYLERLFGGDGAESSTKSKAIQQVRQIVANFERNMASPNQIKPDTLKWVCDGLLSSDLLSYEKREVLKDFQSNSVILGDVIDVLNMRLTSLNSWSWGSDVPLEQRRQINGTYKFVMHEDLIQVILLHYIGVRWSVFLKETFGMLQKDTEIWKTYEKQIPKTDEMRRCYYLGPEIKHETVNSLRDQIFRKYYFMAHLMDSLGQQDKPVQGEEEALQPQVLKSASAFRPQVHQGGALFGSSSAQAQSAGGLFGNSSAQPRQGGSIFGMSSAPNQIAFGSSNQQPLTHSTGLLAEEIPRAFGSPEADVNFGGKRPMESKQRLLHLLSTEITLNTRLYGDITAIHSSFERWDDILPHETILTVMSFFGVSTTWLDFFSKFLRAPLRFIEDGPEAPSRIRSRGTPALHVLSDVLGESVLFCLDLAVNQSTGGAALFRMKDSLWFWSRDHSVAVAAWKSVTEFAHITGTRIDIPKTGTTRVSGDPDVFLGIDPSLPVGEIRWGFLKLSPSTGKFQIDQSMVDEHIVDLRKQLLDQQNSIISLIQAWNIYASTFFNSNFGKAANCFGQDHVSQMLAAHERIQSQVFSNSSSSTSNTGSVQNTTSIIDYLKKLIYERFDISEIPDGYFFFPVELGGLGLQNPFVSILQIHNAVLRDPSKELDHFFAAEQSLYDSCKAKFENGNVYRGNSFDPIWKPQSKFDRENFLSFDEYIRYREDIGYGFPNSLQDIYKRLMKIPTEEEGIQEASIRVIGAVVALQKTTQGGINGNWPTMDPYWKWVAALYGPEVIDRFGGMSIVEPGLLPMGMVSIFRDKRVKWQG